jgi:hypothetical protein
MISASDLGLEQEKPVIVMKHQKKLPLYLKKDNFKVNRQ